MTEFISIAREPGAFQQPLTLDQIRAVCLRAFDSDALLSVHELGGGSFNMVYLVRLVEREPVILRVAPPPECAVPWHEHALMRREHSIQPYLAPIAPLLPQTLMADFTHQVLPRDYVFQTFRAGERWDQIAAILTEAEETRLWRQLAHIAKSIYHTEGPAFGYPYPGQQFPTWSATVLAWLGWCGDDVEATGADATEIRAIGALACEHANVLDEIRVPRLLHGDLWPFNVLIQRDANGPNIVAVLDNDRLSWGDPLADWTFHLLPRKASATARAAFWDAFGYHSQTASVRFRDLIYEGLHAGNVLADVTRRRRDDLVPAVQESLHTVIASLMSHVSTL